MTNIEIEELKKLAQSASCGPWRWELNSKYKTIALVGGKPTFDKTVIDFERWGMSGASPRFNEAISGGEFNIMFRADKWSCVIEGREHHASWLRSLDHPDANWIAAANPQAILSLIAELELAKKYHISALQERNAFIEELEQYKKDAERYRWLKSQPTSIVYDYAKASIGHWDKDIDAAMKKEGE